jgi:hypothetical protein
MDQHSDPIQFLIDFAWANGADRFTVNNAKDELLKLREAINNYQVVAWARINTRGDLYDPRFCYNPFTQEDSIPLYKNKQEFEAWCGRNTK